MAVILMPRKSKQDFIISIDIIITGRERITWSQTTTAIQRIAGPELTITFYGEVIVLFKRFY
jgi:hypothetical protein